VTRTRRRLWRPARPGGHFDEFDPTARYPEADMTTAKTTVAAAGPHDCPGGCGRRVAHDRFACRACWYRLPVELRRPISAAFGRDYGAHAQAMLDALDWYRANRPTTTTGGITR